MSAQPKFCRGPISPQGAVDVLSDDMSHMFRAEVIEVAGSMGGPLLCAVKAPDGQRVVVEALQ